MLPITAATVASLSFLLSTLPAYAQTATPTPTPAKTNFFDGLVKFIADEFHLDQNQVKTAVNTYKSQQQAQHQQNLGDREKTRLDQLVKDGKITQDQENAILDEEKTLQSKYNPQAMKGLSAADRKAKFDAMNTDIQTWAKDHNIDPKYLMPNFGIGMKMGVRRANWRMNKPTTTITPTPTQ
jgi:hypothetical protein